MKQLSIILLSLFLVSCHPASVDEKSLIAKYIGTEVVFPNDISFQLKYKKIELGSLVFDYKIVNYIDSSGCTSCRMKLIQWDEIVDELNAVSENNIECFTIISAPKTNDLIEIINRNKYIHPVAFDSVGCFTKINEITRTETGKTFLLDSDNNIVAIGNPSTNPKVKKLYKRILSDNTCDSRFEKFGNLSSQSLGILAPGAKIDTTFKLSNYDSCAMHIEAVIPSCDCITAEVKTKTLPPYSVAPLDITYSADSIVGNFKKYVDVYYEEKEKPDRLILYGIIN